MEDKINLREEILNIKKELNVLKTENNTLNKKIKDQSQEIQKLKEEYNTDKNKMLSEIEALKQCLYSIKNNKIDNAAPLFYYFKTPISSKTCKIIDQITESGKGEYITDISFYLGNSIDLCVAELIYYGYEQVEGDIRKKAGGLFCILGCKYEKNQPSVTNIIGSVSDKEEPAIIYENGIQYKAVKDPLKNSDIHKGSGGNVLFLYYTKDPKAGKPIKRLKNLLNISTKVNVKNDNIVKYCTRSTKYNKPFEPLDCNRGRSFTPCNYIFIERD